MLAGSGPEREENVFCKMLNNFFNVWSREAEEKVFNVAPLEKKKK